MEPKAQNTITRQSSFELRIRIRRKKALKLLKESLHSDKVLTTVFLSDEYECKNVTIPTEKVDAGGDCFWDNLEGKTSWIEGLAVREKWGKKIGDVEGSWRTGNNTDRFS
ncbi:Uncharacterized protein Fot_30692 [Forsythia ovata]|uniref:Uncharacterized protein n=1 Tax=Forsythia ovata TaxID=205694 RepID=A0ABD1T2V0_9LAMI